ncbi:MAG: ABC transporter ATP-binding protein [Verrucomicrobiota bacterium]|nr:ABC transporter ATP-binding protein [Verrucomicrobiota bacterium]
MKKEDKSQNESLGYKNFLPYFRLLGTDWLPFVAALFFGLVYGASSGFGLPFMIDQVFPKIFPDQSNSPTLSNFELFYLISWFPLVFLIRGASGYFNSYLINYCGLRVLEKIRLQVFAKVQKLPVSFFQKNQGGDLLSRITSDTAQLQSALIGVSNDLLKQPVTFIGAIVALVVMSVQREGMSFMLLCLAVIPICVFPIRRVGEMLMRRALGMQQKVGNMTAVLSENLSAYREVRAFNLEKREESRFKDASEEFLKARMKVVKYSEVLTPLIEILTAAGISFAIFQAARTSIRLDAVVPVITALYIAYEPIKKLGGINNKIKEALASLQRLNEILQADETVIDVKEPMELAGINQGIEFKAVSFAYEAPSQDSTKVSALENVNISVNAGETVALVGPSGAGKSTLINMLCRFQDPVEGSILFDGVDIKKFALKDLRESMSIVPQKPFLFDVSVEENIKIGESKYTSMTIKEASKISNSLGFIEKFPMKFQERLGEQATRVSGGQLQRLALARAFYRNSPILILDEATSALDSENEEIIQDAMKQLIKGKTTFMIAHRFSSIRLANRILVMDNGKLIADGTHDQVYSSCNLYKDLFDRQNQKTKL